MLILAYGVSTKEIILDSDPVSGIDVRSTRPVLGVYTGIVVPLCALLCSQDNCCGGINFLTTLGDDGTCQLINGNDNSSFAASVGFVYYANLLYGVSIKAV